MRRLLGVGLVLIGLIGGTARESAAILLRVDFDGAFLEGPLQGPYQGRFFYEIPGSPFLREDVPLTLTTTQFTQDLSVDLRVNGRIGTIMFGEEGIFPWARFQWIAPAPLSLSTFLPPGREPGTGGEAIFAPGPNLVTWSRNTQQGLQIGQTAVIPEPWGLGLGAALLGMLALRRHRRTQAA